MRFHTLLAASAVGALVTGLTVTPSQADPGPLPDAQSGQLETWGGVNAVEATTVPEEVEGLQLVGLAATGGGTAAVTADGTLHAWGKDTAAEIVAAPDLTDVAAVSLGINAGVALNRDGSVVGWGDQGVDAVPAGLTATAVTTTGQGVSFAVTTDGTLATWGDNDAYPAAPDGLSNLVDVSAVDGLALALDEAGTVHSWGAYVGFGVVPPAEIQGQVAEIAAGGTSAGAILEDGSVRLWGIGAPALPASLTGETVVALDLYGSNAIAATADGDIVAWGTKASITTLPESVVDAHVSAVTIGSDHAAAIVTDFRAAAAPSIAGTATFGQTLTATPAKLSLAPDSPATGQWLANGQPIANATGTTLPMTDKLVGASISYRTTATRGAETVESTSTAVGPVAKASATLSPQKAKFKGKRGAMAKKAIFTAKVITPAGVSPAGTVTLKVKTKGAKARTVTVTVGADGAVKAVLKKVKRGKFKATWTYSGSSTVAATSQTVKAKG